MKPVFEECKTATPWGKADGKYVHGRGVIHYTTPGHGGFHLSKTRNALVPEPFRQSKGWYEEDCEWACVAVSFPELFEPEELEAARKSLRSWSPDEWQAWTGEVVTAAESHVIREREFAAAHAADWVSIACWGDWCETVPEGHFGVCATLGGRRDRGLQERYFLVTKAQHEAESRVVPPDAQPWIGPNKPDVETVVAGPGLFGLIPVTAKGQAWFDKNVEAEPWQWQGGALMFDDRKYAEAIVEGAREAGLVVDCT